MNVSTDLRRCIGSTKFAIEAHDAPPDDFPVQASQKDGLGRMCKPHWTAYTRALRKASVDKSPVALPEPKPMHDALAPALVEPAVEFSPSLRASLNFAAGISPQTRRTRTAPEPIRTRTPKRKGAQFPAAGSQGDAA